MTSWRWLIVLSCLTIACQSGSESESDSGAAIAVPEGYDLFGAAITTDEPIDINVVVSRMDEFQDQTLKISGTITQVCQAKGCWMSLDVAEGEDVIVRFKDYGFFVPKDAAGREVILDGRIEKVQRSVDELRHLAEDAGKSPAEIAAITESEIAISVEASGVLLRQLEL